MFLNSLLPFQGVLKVSLYPYGVARQAQLSNGTWVFSSQHGALENEINQVFFSGPEI